MHQSESTSPLVCAQTYSTNDDGTDLFIYSMSLGECSYCDELLWQNIVYMYMFLFSFNKWFCSCWGSLKVHRSHIFTCSVMRQNDHMCNLSRRTLNCSNRATTIWCDQQTPLAAHPSISVQCAIRRERKHVSLSHLLTTNQP